MPLAFDRDVFQRPPMGQMGQQLVPNPPVGQLTKQPTGSPTAMLKGFGASPILGASVGALGKVGTKTDKTGGGLTSVGGAPAAGGVGGAPAVAAAGGGGGKGKGGGKKAKDPNAPLTGDKLISSLLEKPLRGESGSFGPDVVNNMVSGALQSREAATRTGMDDLNRDLASRGLGRGALGAGMAAGVRRGAAQDYSQNISNIYSDKAKQDFADKMGAIGPYQQHLQAVEAKKRAAASQQLARDRFEWEKSQAANRPAGGGGGGGGDEDMLFKLLMGNEGLF